MKGVSDFSTREHAVGSQHDFSIMVESCAGEHDFLSSISIFTSSPASLKSESHEEQVR
jgi:hypothetical protein